MPRETDARMTGTDARSDAWFRQLADAMPQIVWTAGPDGRVDYYNQRWIDYTGLLPEQTFAVDGWWQLLLPPDDIASCGQQWAEAVRTLQPFQRECRFHDHRANDYRWFLVRATPVRDDSGRVLRWFGTCTDINDQKRSQEALQEDSCRKDALLAMLSHELRNPLAPIVNAMQVLRLGELTDPTLDAARHVLDRQVRHLAGIVNDLLDLFRLLHRKITLSLETIDLPTLMRSLAEEHQPALEEAGLTMNLDLPERSFCVQADRYRLRQVIRNLVRNAVKFSSPGDCVTIGIRATVDGQRAAVFIRDTGQGMSPELQQQLFATFSQGRQDLARKEGGLGLGLGLVKAIVELHGGQVRATSAGIGQGSEFVFDLPLCTPNTTPATPVPSRTCLPHRPLRLLIVEDNVDTAETLQVLLQHFGHEVRMAHTGRAGVCLARRWHPDVVLCDLGLPELDGFGVAQTLRKDPEMENTRLIAISGYSQEEDRRRSAEVGFELHLAKPVDPLELRQILSELSIPQ